MTFCVELSFCTNKRNNLTSHNPWLAAFHVNRGQPFHSFLNSTFSIETDIVEKNVKYAIYKYNKKYKQESD